MFLLLALLSKVVWQTDGDFAGALESMHVGEASHLVLTSRSTARPAWIRSACKFHSFFSVYFPIHAFLIFKKGYTLYYDPNLNQGTCSMSITVFFSHL